MNDLRLALSQIGSSDILKEFCLYLCKNELCMQICIIALVNLVLLVFGGNGMCTKLGGN
jgi:hypothetical protein